MTPNTTVDGRAQSDAEEHSNRRHDEVTPNISNMKKHRYSTREQQFHASLKKEPRGIRL
mgnify:CR=1 FL=1